MPTPTRAPDHVFVAPSLVRRVFQVVLAVSLAGLAYAVWRAWQQPDAVSGSLAVGLAVLVVLCWMTLLMSVPQRITITGSHIVIRRAGENHRFDLEDPGVDMLVRDGSVAFGHYRDNWVIVEAREVEWSTFMDVVMAYQNRADLNAEARDERFRR